MQESGKWFRITSLLGMGGNQPKASDSTGCVTRGKGMGRKPLSDRMLTRAHKGVRDIH